jgi:CRISPR-associated exonuclease Cas4
MIASIRLVRDEAWQVRAIWLKSERYRLIGKADLVEVREGQWFPIEYKRGQKGEYNNDALQVCAQALCLEEMTGQPITFGYIYYAQTHQRQVVELSAELRQEVLVTIQAIQTLFETGQVPPAIYTPRCQGCSLYGQCLPKAAAKVSQYRESN